MALDLLPICLAEAIHKMLQQGLQILRNLEHRGATGQDPLSGDGAGILVEIPDIFPFS